MIKNKSRAWSGEGYKHAEVDHAIHLTFPEIKSNSEVSTKSSPPGAGEKEITVHKHADLGSYYHQDKKHGCMFTCKTKAMRGGEWLDDLGSRWLQA